MGNAEGFPSWLLTCIHLGVDGRPAPIRHGAAQPLPIGEIEPMNLLNVLIQLHKDEEGQGLVEYLLILALVAFAATAGMGSLASFLNQAFSAVGSLLNYYIS